jgi:hypothetical protein
LACSDAAAICSLLKQWAVAAAAADDDDAPSQAQTHSDTRRRQYLELWNLNHPFSMIEIV